MERFIEFHQFRDRMPEPAKRIFDSRNDSFKVFTDLETGDVDIEKMIQAMTMVRSNAKNKSIMMDSLYAELSKNGLISGDPEDRIFLTETLANGYIHNLKMWDHILDLHGQSK